MKLSLLPALCFALSLTSLAAEPLRVACLGDSLTQGAKVNAATESYPAQLQAMLGAGFVVKNFGLGGATLWPGGKPNASQELTSAIGFAPQIAIITFGTNDTRSRDAAYWSHFDEFDASLTKLLDGLLAAQPKPRLLVCFSPAIQADMPGMNDEVKANRVERQPRLAEMRAKITAHVQRRAGDGIVIVDLFTPTEKRPELYDNDGVHMKADGYRVLAETLRPFVEKAAH